MPQYIHTLVIEEKYFLPGAMMSKDSKMARRNWLALIFTVTLVITLFVTSQSVHCTDLDCSDNQESKSDRLASLVSKHRYAVRNGANPSSYEIIEEIVSKAQKEKLFDNNYNNGEEELDQFRRLIKLLEARERCFQLLAPDAVEGVRLLIKFMQELAKSYVKPAASKGVKAARTECYNEVKRLKLANQELVQQTEKLAKQERELVEQKEELVQKNAKLAKQMRDELVERKQELVQQNEKLAKQELELVEQKQKMLEQKQALESEKAALVAELAYKDKIISDNDWLIEKLGWEKAALTGKIWGAPGGKVRGLVGEIEELKDRYIQLRIKLDPAYRARREMHLKKKEAAIEAGREYSNPEFDEFHFAPDDDMLMMTT
uniref:Uncharacterized protein n=1 Tax=Aceria tosichella TaxID=561515 RepID=A0A6G1SE44_9ACAR